MTPPPQLWLKWNRAQHSNGMIKLMNPQFYGPVMADCDPIEPTGNIILDFTTHMILITPKPYTIDLRWGHLISQTPTIALFDYMLIDDKEIGKLKLLKHSDKILIDCTGHRSELRAAGKSLMFYKATLYNDLGEPYPF